MPKLYNYLQIVESINVMQIPSINRKAYYWHDLIDRNDLTTELLLIKHFSTYELRLVIYNGINSDIANVPSHNYVCCGFESPHSTILAKIKSRKIRQFFLQNACILKLMTVWHCDQ